MSYTLEFYSESVQGDILAWPDGIQASFTRIVEQMMEHGPNLGMPYTRPFGDGRSRFAPRGVKELGALSFACSLVAAL